MSGKTNIRLVLYGPSTAYGAKRRSNVKKFTWYVTWYDGRIRRERSLGVHHGDDYAPALSAFIEGGGQNASGRNNSAPARVGATAEAQTDSVCEILTHYHDQHGLHAIDASGLKRRVDLLKKFFATDKLPDLTELRCRAFADTRRKESTARLELGTLQTAIRYGAVKTNPPRNALITVWRPPKPDRKDRVMSRSEQARMLWHWRRRRHLRLILRLLIWTGARVSSVLDLRWERNAEGGWVDLKAGVIHLKPHGRARTKKEKPTIPIPPHLTNALRIAKQAGHEQVCASDRTGAAPSLKSFEGTWADACRDLKIVGVTPHTTRHTTITDLIERKEHPSLVSRLTGASIETIHREYLHLKPSAVAHLVKRRRS